MTEVLKAGVLSDEIDLGALAHNAAEQAEEFVRKVSSNCNFVDQIENKVFCFRFGKPAGKFATIKIYQSGFKIMTFYTEIIAHHYHHSGLALNPSFACILKLGISGPIY